MSISTNKKWLIAVALELGFVVYVYILATGSKATDNVGAGWSGAWVFFILLPATLIAWALDYRLHRKNINSSKIEIIDPNWQARRNKIIITIVVLFGISLLVSFVSSLLDYNGQIGCKPSDNPPKSWICAIKGESG